MKVENAATWARSAFLKSKKKGPSASLCRGTPVLTRSFYISLRGSAKGTMGAQCGTREPAMSGNGRVADACDLAGTRNTLGAPSFAHLAKGGSSDCLGPNPSRGRRSKTFLSSFIQPHRSYQQHRIPPLQKPQGRGTRCSGTGRKTDGEGCGT